MGACPAAYRIFFGTDRDHVFLHSQRQGGLVVEPLTIIIIDDDEAHFTLMNRAIVKKFPHASVYHLKEANDCLKRLDEIKPTVIITDYLLPGMNGIEFLEALNQQDIDIPVIMITGQGDENIAVRTMKLGVKEYLVKSGDVFNLLPGVIEKVVRERKLEQSLRESEEKYRLVLDSATIGIVLVQDEFFKFVNPQFAHISGYSQEELTTRHFSDFIHPDDRTMTAEYHIKRLKGEEVPETYLFKIISKDGKTKWLENKGVVFQWEGHPASLNFLSDVTERKQSEDLVRNLSQMLIHAQERERHMIAFELHDSIGQNLSTLKISCDTFFDGQSEIPSELSEKRMKLSKLIQQTITAVRNLAYDLRPPGLDEMGLVQALDMYCEEFSENSGVKVDFQPAGLHKLDLDFDAEIHLYRLAQEGLNNIRKHADAEQATITLIGSFPNIILRIEDNGKGFDVKARELALCNEKRMGLRSMKERVNLLGGQMTIQSRLMQGTKVFIKIPYKGQKDESEKTHINR